MTCIVTNSTSIHLYYFFTLNKVTSFVDLVVLKNDYSKSSSKNEGEEQETDNESKVEILVEGVG